MNEMNSQRVKANEATEIPSQNKRETRWKQDNNKKLREGNEWGLS